MSVVNMFSFDQFPTRGVITQQQLDTEDYALLAMGPSAATIGIGPVNNRQWVQFNFQLQATTAQVWRFGRISTAKTFRQAFGNPSVVTKGVISCRINVTSIGFGIFSSLISTTASVLWDGSGSVDGNVLSNLPVGEHFLEFEVDFVNKSFKTYLNGTLFSDQSRAGLTLDTTFSLGFHAMYTGNYSQGIVGSMTDIVFIYDNQNGDVSGRLGPIKVLNTPVEEIEVPQSWKGADEYFKTYSLRDGGTWDACTIIPQLATDPDFINQFTLSTSPALGAGSLTGFLAETTTRNYWTTTAGTVLSMTIACAEAKKVSGYVLQSYGTNLGFFDSWKFQGSNDGTAWVDLDVRAAGQAAYFQQQTSRVVAFKLAPDKVGSYKQYRLVTTAIAVVTGRVEFYHFNLLTDPADIVENNVRPALNRVANASVTPDYDYPVMRAAIDESEGSFGFKIPDYGSADVIAVKVGVVARRDQGSSEHLIAKVKVGANETSPVDFELKAHAEGILPVATLQKAPGGAAWTKEALESLRVVLKTKRGAN